MNADPFDHEYVEETGRQVGLVLGSGRVAALEFAPGNGTRYELVLVPSTALVPVTDRAASIPLGFGLDAGDRREVVTVALLNFGTSYAFRMLGRMDAPHESYLTEKLGVSLGDAAALRVLFAAIGQATAIVGQR